MKRHAMKIGGCVVVLAVIIGLLLNYRMSKSLSTSPTTTESWTTLKIMLPSEPADDDFDLVIAEAERRMADSLRIKLDIDRVPWSELEKRTNLALASGEEIDLIFDAPWLHINKAVANGYYAPLDELLAEYGPSIIDNRPELMWKANKFGGKVMAIPLGNSYTMGQSYFVRKDIREKYGVPPIRSYEELIDFAYLVKEKEPQLIPMNAAGSTSMQVYSLATFRHYHDYDTYVRPTPALGNSLMLYRKNNEAKIYNVFDGTDQTVLNWIHEARQLYLDGIMHPDVLAIKNFQEEKVVRNVAILPTGIFRVDDRFQKMIRQHEPDAEIEAVTFFDTRPGANISDFRQWNFIAVPEVSKHKKEAIQFLNWANEKENYDLLAYGIEGKHWKAIGDDQMEQISFDYPVTPYVWITNPVHDRHNRKLDSMELRGFASNPDNFEPDILTGFEFDSTKIQSELLEYQKIEMEYYLPLFNGVVDPESTLKQFAEKAEGPLKRIQTELQRQIDLFLSNK